MSDSIEADGEPIAYCTACKHVVSHAVQEHQAESAFCDKGDIVC